MVTRVFCFMRSNAVSQNPMRLEIVMGTCSPVLIQDVPEQIDKSKEGESIHFSISAGCIFKLSP